MAKIRKDTAKNAPLPASGQDFIRDDDLKGFAIRITAAGAKSYIWEGRIKHRPRRITLGLCSDLTALVARKKAESIRAAITNGHDPSAERTAERREATLASTLEEYFEQVQDRDAPRTLQDKQGLLRRYVPNGWRGRKLSDISHNDVLKLHSAVGREHGHYAANQTIRFLRHVFNCAQLWGMARKDQNPACGVKLFKETKRKRFLSPEELRRVNESLLQETNLYWRAFFPLSLLVGTRKSELLSARWEDFKIDEAAPTWTIPHTKSGEPHQIPLPMVAVAILRELPSRETSKWVFPSRGKTGHLVEIKAAWKRIRDRAGVPDVRAHDLRRTLGSWLAASGNSLPMIGAALGHSQPSTTAIYARISLDPVRAALEANASQMLALGGLGATPAAILTENVVELQPAVNRA